MRVVVVGPATVVTVQAVGTANRSATAVLRAADLVAATLQAEAPVEATIELEYARFVCELFVFVEFVAHQVVAATEVKRQAAEAMVATVHSELATVQVAATIAKPDFGLPSSRKTSLNVGFNIARGRCALPLDAADCHD